MGRSRPLAFVEDIGITPDDLPAFVARSSLILKRFEASASFLIHVATGQMHLRPFLNPDQPGDAAKLWPLADELHGLAMELGGTISSQHGTGIARTPWVEKQVGPLFPVFREVKRLFDPRGILNPGKIVGPDPSRPAWPLRKPVIETTVAPEGNETRTRLLVWKTDELATAVGRLQRLRDLPHRRTESAHVSDVSGLHEEAATPRAKANLFRAILEGSIDPDNDDVARRGRSLRQLQDVRVRVSGPGQHSQADA